MIMIVYELQNFCEKLLKSRRSVITTGYCDQNFFREELMKIHQVKMKGSCVILFVFKGWIPLEAA